MGMYPCSPLEGANTPGQKLNLIVWSFTHGTGFAWRVAGDTQGISEYNPGSWWLSPQVPVQIAALGSSCVMEKLMSWRLTPGHPPGSPGTIQVPVRFLPFSLADLRVWMVGYRRWESNELSFSSPYLTVFPPDPAASGFYQVLLWLSLVLPRFISYLIVMISWSPAWERGTDRVSKHPESTKAQIEHWARVTQSPI